MKSVLIALTVMLAGLNSGCAQIERLQNPANYRVNELTGQRVYCHGDQRDMYTVCEGWQSPEQIARKAEQEKIAQENALIAAEKQTMRYGTTKEREALVYASINRVRVAQRDEVIDKSGGYAITDEESELLAWAETPNVTITEMKNTLRVREIKMIAQAKVDAENQKKMEAEDKRIAANTQKLAEAFGEKGRAVWNAMTPEQRAARTAEIERSRAESHRRRHEASERQRAKDERNLFCHRNFGRSC